MSFPESTAKYDIVKSELQDEKDTESGQKRRKCPFTTTTLMVMLMATTFGLLSFLVLGVYYKHYGDVLDASSPTTPRCGNSSAEALERGCHFDQLMWSWYPPECPHYANDHYLTASPGRPWRFFSDPYQVIEATDDDWTRALNNEMNVYGERQEHLAHCVFMFLSMAQIIQTNGRYTPKYRDAEHSEHCAQILMEVISADSRREMVETSAGPVMFDETC